jgi:hypothetical protein
VDSSTGEIIVSTRFLEALWVAAYVNSIYYDLAEKKGALRGQVEINPQAEPQLLAAMQLSHWMLSSIIDPNVPKEWPTGLPRPNENADKQSWENVADEMTLAGCGFILLHEIAHAKWKHKLSGDTAKNISQEEQADQQAVDWYFADYPDSHSNDRIKRGYGIASALVLLVGIGMFAGNFSSSTHPPSHKRLREVLKSIENDPVHPVFAFSAQLLPLYRILKGDAGARGASTNYLDALDRSIDELSRSFPAPP